MDFTEVITPSLLSYIKDTYRLKWDGLHGWDHWVRVWENGMRLAGQNGADLTIVTLFAFTHDMARFSDHMDLNHGPRAARRIQAELQGKYFQLEKTALDQLVTAVRLHTRGLLEADITVQTCWDSDRLDLGRAGIRPIARRMCTQAARDPDTIAWAYQRSLDWLEQRK